MHKIIEKSFASVTLLFLVLTLFSPLAYAANPITQATKCVVRSTVSAVDVGTLVGGVSPAEIAVGTELSSTSTPAEVGAGFGVICTFALVQQIFAILFLIVGTISVIIILYSAYLFLTSAGDSKKTILARDYLMYAAVGIVLAVVAKIVPSAVIGFLGAK